MPSKIFAFSVWVTIAAAASGVRFICNDEKCSAPLYDCEGKALHTRPIAKDYELNVKSGDTVYVHGMSTDNETYLVKKKETDELKTFPKEGLKIPCGRRKISFEVEVTFEKININGPNARKISVKCARNRFLDIIDEMFFSKSNSSSGKVAFLNVKYFDTSNIRLSDRDAAVHSENETYANVSAGETNATNVTVETAGSANATEMPVKVSLDADNGTEHATEDEKLVSIEVAEENEKREIENVLNYDIGKTSGAGRDGEANGSTILNDNSSSLVESPYDSSATDENSTVVERSSADGTSANLSRSVDVVNENASNANSEAYKAVAANATNETSFERDEASNSSEIIDEEFVTDANVKVDGEASFESSEENESEDGGDENATATSARSEIVGPTIVAGRAEGVAANEKSKIAYNSETVDVVSEPDSSTTANFQFPQADTSNSVRPVKDDADARPSSDRDRIDGAKITERPTDTGTNDFYDVVRNGARLESSPPPENVRVLDESGYADLFFELASNAWIVIEKYSGRLIDSSRWFSEQPSSARVELDASAQTDDEKGNDEDVNGAFGWLRDANGSFSWKLSNKSTVAVIFGVSSFCILCLVVPSLLRLNSKVKKKVRDSLAVINRLEQKLLIAKKELSLFEENGLATGSQHFSSSRTETNDRVAASEEQIVALRRRNTELEDKILYLEKELEHVSTSALEIHKLLENSLTTQTGSKTAEEDVEMLRTLTEKQEIQIEDLMKEMDAVVTENQCLKEDLKKMERECGAQTKRNLELAEKHRDLTLSLERQIENNASLKSTYKSEIYRLQSKLEDTEMNLRRYEFQIEELSRIALDKPEGKPSAECKSIDEQTKLMLQISTLTAMNNELVVDLKEQKNARRMLDEHAGDVIKELKDLRKSYELVEKERNEAVTKLHVLTNYFNDKETQLHKALEAKEKLFAENESKDQLLSQKLTSLNEEIRNYKIRNEELKKEIHNQEGSYKIQLAAAEQKARDLWFALRQAERKYQENEKEAATLRNKILILETNLSSVNQKLNEKSGNVNGDVSPVPILYCSAMSPDLLPYRGSAEIIPPPPSPVASHSPEFFPPEPSYSPDERLPPLGGRRVPSPPLLIADEDDLKPPFPHSQYMPAGRSRNEPPMPTSFLRTPPPASRITTLYSTRRPRNSADSPSSGVSVESLDKSGR